MLSCFRAMVFFQPTLSMKKNTTPPVDTEKPIVKPPFFSSWSGWYWLVLGNLAFLIVLFYIITRVYS